MSLYKISSQFTEYVEKHHPKNSKIIIEDMKKAIDNLYAGTPMAVQCLENQM